MSVWLTALKLVPWDDVLKSTPGLVRQARQLFRSSKGQQPASASQEVAAEALDGRDPKAMAALVRGLHERVQVLEKEQRETAALLESLAEQQEMVVQTLGALRARAKLLTAVCGVLMLAVVGLLTWVSRH
ncbi:hypothetical protein GT347_23790 [Xylophilus rhododendri]|uniref:Uncharacterized protein n=1 Tax=Xylophilus rhododendri TaxID=2697032 RepID=A0A857JDA2_9BURK|nr:hypothetical protein [Xylophilus rhododendri]QHJ00739.1 hypothetical protein GT347_23790 [Xylophilus rhododendri]